MNILILGAAGFIGTNLTLRLAKDPQTQITLVDSDLSYFRPVQAFGLPNITYKVSAFHSDTSFDEFLEGQDIVYHLFSTTMPTTSNQHIPQEFLSNVVTTMNMLEACVRCQTKRIVFISSGGAVYGKEAICPISENTVTLPITSYGLQKINIEQTLYLYHYMYGLDYRILRLANPYGPYQRPNGKLGAITTFIYKALRSEEIIVYGDGSVVRDFIYIDDAVRALINVAEGNADLKIFNIGSGKGTSIDQALALIQSTLNIPLKITYRNGRKVDVPVNYLDISRYETIYGRLYEFPTCAYIVRQAGIQRLNLKYIR